MGIASGGAQLVSRTSDKIKSLRTSRKCVKIAQSRSLVQEYQYQGAVRNIWRKLRLWIVGVEIVAVGSGLNTGS